MWIDWITESGSSRLRTRRPRAPTRTARPSPSAVRSASSLTACGAASSVATVPGSPRQIRVSILPPSSPRACDLRRAVAGEAVVELEGGALRPPRFIEPMTTLPSSAPSSSRSSRMSGVPSTPSTPGRSSAVDEPVEQLGPAGHRHRVVADAERARAGWSAATISSRPSSRQQRAQRALVPRRRAIRPGARAELGEVGPVSHPAHLAAPRSRSAARGQRGLDLGRRRHGRRALEPAGDDGPGDVGERGWCAQRPAREQPCTSAPPKASPAPSPLTTSTGKGSPRPARRGSPRAPPAGPA